MPVWQIILLVVIGAALYCCTSILHELGHYLACIALRIKVVSLKIYFLNFYWVDDHTDLIWSWKGSNHCRFMTPQKGQMIIAVLAGPIVDFISIFLLFIVYAYLRPQWFSYSFCIAGIVCFLSLVYNALPWINGDGALIYKALQGEK